MLDVFRQFEQSVSGYDTMVLVLPGLVGVLLGIFLWLGGSLFARISVGVIWLLIVAVVGIYFVEPLISLGIGVMAAIVVMLFKRFSAGVLTSILVTFVVFLMICQFTDLSGDTAFSGPPAAQTPAPLSDGQRMGPADTFGHLKLMLFRLYESAVQVGQALDVKYQVVLGVTAFFALLMGCALRRLNEAVSCATAGVLLIWGGMVLLLLSKGGKPLSGLHAGAATYTPIIPAMIGVGALEQLLFCSKPSSHGQGKTESGGKKSK